MLRPLLKMVSLTRPPADFAPDNYVASLLPTRLALCKRETLLVKP